MINTQQNKASTAKPMINTQQNEASIALMKASYNTKHDPKSFNISNRSKGTQNNNHYYKKITSNGQETSRTPFTETSFPSFIPHSLELESSLVEGT